jgi:hypothetical protein
MTSDIQAVVNEYEEMNKKLLLIIEKLVEKKKKEGDEKSRTSN